MTKSERNALIALPVILIVAAGLAAAGSQTSAVVFGLPLYAISVGLAFLIQWIVFVPSYINRTEHFFDLTGSITYITVATAAVILSPEKDARTYLLLALVVIWAARLGTFLFMRVRKAGADNRFDEIKVSFLRFLLTWTLQGLWVSFSLAGALVAITSAEKEPLGLFALAGFLVWLVGFGIEAAADAQKNRFRANPENKGKFISSGLWALSRHPNYFGEITLWVGVLIIALPILKGWGWVALISPIFITLLLTRISGVPMLERRADEKWGGQPDYEAYKARTPVLVPLPPRQSS